MRWLAIALPIVALGGCALIDAMRGSAYDDRSTYDRWYYECLASGGEPSIGPVTSPASGGRDVYRCTDGGSGRIMRWRTQP